MKGAHQMLIRAIDKQTPKITVKIAVALAVNHSSRVLVAKRKHKHAYVDNKRNEIAQECIRIRVYTTHVHTLHVIKSTNNCVVDTHSGAQNMFSIFNPLFNTDFFLRLTLLNVIQMYVCMCTYGKVHTWQRKHEGSHVCMFRFCNCQSLLFSKN